MSVWQIGRFSRTNTFAFRIKTVYSTSFSYVMVTFKFADQQFRVQATIIQWYFIYNCYT